MWLLTYIINIHCRNHEWDNEDETTNWNFKNEVKYFKRCGVADKKVKEQRTNTLKELMKVRKYTNTDLSDQHE